MHKPAAVILLNWNTPEHTADCISTLLQYCDETLFDIIVADNGSTDNSLHLLKARFPDVVYIENGENLGFAEGNNRALAYSICKGYTYSLVMNNDTSVDEDLVTGLVKHMESHPGAAAVQPAIYWMHKKTEIWNGEGKFNRILGKTISDTKVPGQTALNTYKCAEWITGCCMLLRNAALSESGMFNKLFFLYFEDVDLSFRLRKAGFELHYLPRCKMYHEAGASATVEKKEGFLSPVIHYYIARNHIWILRKYGKPVFFPFYFIYNGLYYLSLLTYFILRGRKEKAKYLIRGLKEGLFTAKTIIWPQNS